MITIENVVLPSPEQWQAIIRGMRNPKNSWELSDSGCANCDGNCDECKLGDFYIGEKDLDLMGRLANAGSVHGKYRRMITLYADITAPLYWY